MQVTELISDGLKRELKVTVPARELGAKLDERLNDLKGRVRINGFRPGKVPVSHLRRVYGRSVMAEILQEAVTQTSQKAIEERNEKPAMHPEIKLSEDEKEIEGVFEGQGDLAFTMSFEILPQITVGDFSKLSVVKETAEVSDQEVEDALAALARQNRPFAPKGEGLGAETGDRLTVDYVGRVDGEAFEGGSAAGAFLDLGSGQFIPGFEEQLVGAKAGEERKVTVTFPEDYAAGHLAGKTAEFEVTVREIASPGETEIGDDFAKQLGLESLDRLKEALRAQIAGEYSQAVRRKLKRRLLDALDETYRFDLPPTLVAQEFEAIWREVTGELERQGKTFADENTTEEKAREDYRKIAERRVRLGLVLAEVGSKNNIEVADDEVQRALVERARQFPGQEQAVWDFYRKNPQAQAQLRAPIFEDKVVDFILELAEVKETPVSREVLFADPDEGAAGAGSTSGEAA